MASESEELEQLRAGRAWRSHRPARPDEHAAGRRTEFQRDSDRVLYGSAFRRLGGITQVAAADESEGLHTRLTHSLKVAQVGKRLAEKIIAEAERDYPGKGELYLLKFGGCDADVVEAAGLAHDIGHPPWAHHGETTLHDLAGQGVTFNGNAQTLRVLAVLSHRDVEPGLNLTRAALNAVLKYPWLRSDAQNEHDKWSVYATEQKLFEAIRQDAPPIVCREVSTVGGKVPSLEAAIMDWADDITYAVHDVEDFYRAGLLPLHELVQASPTDDRSPWRKIVDFAMSRDRSDLRAIGEEAAMAAVLRVNKKMKALLSALDHPFDDSLLTRAYLKLFASDQIGHYLDGVEPQPPAAGTVLKISEHARHDVALLKELVWFYVIGRPGLASLQVAQAGMLHMLFEYYLACVKATNGPTDDAFMGHLKADARLVPQRVRDRLAAGDEPNVAVRDLIAGLTETTAQRIYHRLNAVGAGGVAGSLL